MSPTSPALAGRFLTTEPPGKSECYLTDDIIVLLCSGHIQETSDPSGKRSDLSPLPKINTILKNQETKCLEMLCIKY